MKDCGTFTWFGFLLPFKSRLKMIREAGFKTVCTWFGDDFSEMDGDYRAHAELASKYDLELEHAHLPYFGADHLWRDNLNGQHIYESYLNRIREARTVGVGTLVLHPFEKNKPPYSSKICVERFKRMGDAAYKYEVRLAVENLTDNDPTSEIITAADNPNIGLCFDTGHNNIVAQGGFLLLREFADKIFALHAHDNNANHDSHLLPYEGSLDWLSFTQEIYHTKYDKSFMLEACNPGNYEDLESDANQYNNAYPEEQAMMYLKKAYERCRRVLAGA